MQVKPFSRRVSGGLTLALSLIPWSGWVLPAQEKEVPNIIIILADDLGYGDLGCFGHPTIQTPRLDQMAAEGQKWTSFYAGAIVCTPSRAALITGRYAIRSGLVSDRTWVLPHDAAAGLPDEEITLSRVLQGRGYATGYLGKWHLGQLPRYLPTRRGFDYFFGTPYSNDEKVADEWRHEFTGKRSWEVSLFYEPRSEYWDIPLMRNEKILERPVDQTRLTQRYTQEAIRFIRRHKKRPFFLYLSHNMPHVPLFASPRFRGKSRAGPYGDAVEELDWSTGQILDVLRQEGLAGKTLVVFTSDNGPWAAFREHGGSSGLLRDQKGTTWEGGLRVPAIFWWPGRVPPGVVAGIGSAMDLFNTAIALAGGEVPDDRVIDGVDLSPALFGQGPSPRRTLLYYRGRRVWAVRAGPFKAHFSTKPEWGHNLVEEKHDPPLLFHLEEDPSERFDVAADHPEVLAEIREILRRHLEDLVPGEDLLVKRLPRE